MGREQELLEAARNGQVDIVEKILNLRLKKVNSLASLRKLPGPNTQDHSGYTSLHYAALNNHKNVVRSLLKYDANVNLTDKKKCTPLHLASWAGNYDIVNYILMQSNIEPNLNLVNSDNESALHSASQFNHHSVVSLLLMHGADLNLRNSKDETAFDLACEYGRYETVKVFLDYKPDLVYTSNRKSHSPLHLACKNGHLSVAKLLLNANFDVNTLTENGSALHESVFYGRLDLVRLLLEYGIDTLLVNQQGKNVFDLLAQLNTSVSRTIESIIENHHQLQQQHTHQHSHNAINKSTSVHCILPPDQYKDKNQTSELVAYAFAAESSQSYSGNFCVDYSNMNSSSREFAQQSLNQNSLNQHSLNYYLDSANVNATKFNSTHRSSRKKVTPLDYGEGKLKSMSNFSRSQDSILDDYLLAASTSNAQTHYDQPKSSKKKIKPQLSTFVQHPNSIYTSSSKRSPPLPLQAASDDIYTSLDEPIYSYPSQRNHNTDDLQPHSLQNDHLKQMKPYSSFDYGHHHNSVHNLQHYKQPISQYTQQQQQRSHHSTSKSMNYLNRTQKMSYDSSNYGQLDTGHDDSGYSMTTYQTIERDRDLADDQQANSICDHHLNSNSSYSLSNQSEQSVPERNHQSGMNNQSSMKRSTSNASDNYPNRQMSFRSSKDHNLKLKRYSTVMDELKNNRLSCNAIRNGQNSITETVQRIKVNSNDLYAQVDKTRKNSIRETSNTGNHLLDFYDQPSKVIKKVTNQPHMTVEQIELFSEIERKIEKSSSKNKSLSSTHSFDERPSSSSYQADNSQNDELNESCRLRDQTTFVKAKLNREKRATIAITSNDVKELKSLESRPPPPSARVAVDQISKILRPIHENYIKMKLNPSKQTQTEEKQFNRFFLKGKFQKGRKMVIIQRELQPQTTDKCLVDQSIWTEEVCDENSTKKKIDDQVKDDRNSEHTKSSGNDLIDLEELRLLENKFNQIKSTREQTSSPTFSSSAQKSTSGSILRPRRQAPAPPVPVHQNGSNTIKSSSSADENKKNEKDTLKSTSSADKVESSLNEKILEKVDKNLSTKELDLLTKTLNLPLNLDWKHDPLTLYKQTCHYLAFYLGSNKVKNLQGALSSQQCIREYRNLLNENKLSSLTAVIISINYKCVRCVDVNSQKIINEHEIRSVHFACQDMDHFRFFAYVTKDSEDRNYMNCHVFSACSLEMTSEILITLAQSFQIAFRITNGETIDQLRKHYVRSKLANNQSNKKNCQNKANKLPSPPPRRSSSSTCSLDRDPNLSKSLSESQFNKLLISVSNGFRSSSRKSSRDRNESLSCKGEPTFRSKHMISASNSIKSIKSVKSESNFLNNRRKSLQMNVTSHLTHQMNSLNNLNNLIKPAKPPLKHQTSLPEGNSKLNHNIKKPQVPAKPKIIQR